MSAWSLRDLMATVNHPNYLKEDVRLIDEQRFIQALMDAVLRKRRPKPATVSKQCSREQTNSNDSGIMMHHPTETTKQIVHP